MYTYWVAGVCVCVWGGRVVGSKISKSGRTYFMDDPLRGSKDSKTRFLRLSYQYKFLFSCLLINYVLCFRTLSRSFIKRPANSTTRTASGQTDTTSGQTSNKSRQTNGQTNTTSGQTSTTSR